MVGAAGDLEGEDVGVAGEDVPAAGAVAGLAAAGAGADGIRASCHGFFTNGPHKSAVLFFGRLFVRRYSI